MDVWGTESFLFWYEYLEACINAGNFLAAFLAPPSLTARMLTVEACGGTRDRF